MKNKPSIGIVHYTYPPIIGGVEKIVFDHAQFFAKYGYETSIFSGEGRNENKQIKLIVIPEFRSLGITNPSLREQILTQSDFPPEFYQQKNAIYKKIEISFQSTDIFFIHNILTFTFNPCLNAALIEYINNHKEKKFVVWIHDVILDPMRKKRTFASSQLHDLFYKPIPSAFYVGISQFLKNTLIDEVGFPKNLVTVIPNGVDINNLLNLHPLTQKILSKYKILGSDPLIFLPTKIMPHKNIDLCLKILAEIKKKRENPFLIITAKNFPHNKNVSYLEEIANLMQKLNLKNEVLLLHNEIGQKEQETEYQIVNDFYRLSDIVFFLSSFENFGLPLLEAGITKTPILLSNLEVFKEIEPENVYYVDIENENSEAIAKKVIEITEKDMRLSFFRKVKSEYNFYYIFQSKILPYIEEIWSK